MLVKGGGDVYVEAAEELESAFAHIIIVGEEFWFYLRIL